MNFLFLYNTVSIIYAIFYLQSVEFSFVLTCFHYTNLNIFIVDTNYFEIFQYFL